MRKQLRILALAGLTAAGLAAGSTPAFAQNPPEGVEVLARGPIHEAYATTTEQPTASTIVTKRPPDAVEELPPDQKPDGENVQFIPGYWHFDEERSDYVWVSGFWRATPPGRVWVPGSWREAVGGWQWTAGFWQETTPQVQPQIEYLPPPPNPLETAPATPAPTATSFYVPGSWVYRNRYVWRPGFWIEYRPGWVWTPAHFRWTPVGYIYVDGYWDYPLAGRGVLFAPVYFTPAVLRPAYVYTPVYVVREPVLYGSLFIRAGYGGYYFGDYFEARYATSGFSAWIGTSGSGFAIGIGVGTAPRRYDPLWDYYRYTYRNDPAWVTNVTAVYTGRYNGTIARPPVTLVQQNTVVNNITNNNTTIINNNTTVNNQTVLTTLNNVSKVDKTVVLKPVTKDQQVSEQKLAKDLKEVSAQRARLETTLVSRGQVATKATDPVRAVKLDVPKQVVARAQVPVDEKKAPPPPATKLPPVTAAAPKADPKPELKGAPQRFDPSKADPPKTGTPPKVDPPKTGTPPKVEAPKTDPKGLPPKADPKGLPPKVDPPKTDPKSLPPKTDPPAPDPNKPKGGEAGMRQRFDPLPMTTAPTPKPAPPATTIPPPKPTTPMPVAGQPKPTAPIPATGTLPPKPTTPTPPGRSPPPPDDKDKKKDDPKKTS
jgi:hypothetical protein